MSNLYHRKLLTDYDVSVIIQELENAIVYLQSSTAATEGATRDPLIHRLELRREILSAVQTDEIMTEQRVSSWGRCLDLLPVLATTTRLGVPVEDSFSAKLQRRLASSVPPRPIVKISFDDAHAYLTNLCRYARDAYRILDYHRVSNLLVGKDHPS